jgi:hypothetical protein
MTAFLSRYLGDSAYWANKRWEYLQAARECRSALIDPRMTLSFAWRDCNGVDRVLPSEIIPPLCDKDDPSVKDAVGVWVEKARNAHAFALGRKPLISNFVFVDHGVATAGELYARAPA